MNMHVRRSRHTTHPRDDLLGQGIVVRRTTRHLDVDGSGQAEVEDLGGDVGRLEEESQLRELLRQVGAQVLDELVGRGMVFLEGDEDLSVGGTDGAGGGIGEVDATDGQSDVIEDQVELVGRNGGSDLVFDLGEEAFGLFDAGTGGSTDMESEGAGIHGGKEVLPDVGKEHAGTQKEQRKRDNDNSAMMQGPE